MFDILYLGQYVECIFLELSESGFSYFVELTLSN